MNITALAVAHQFVNVAESAGAVDNPLIVAMLRLEDPAAEHDEIAWCSAFVNFVAWLLGLPRSRSLAARSWLTVGTPIALADAIAGYDVVVLKRSGERQPGPEVLAAPGHVGFYWARAGDAVYVLGGNQGDRVSIEAFPSARLLGVRRLWATPPAGSNA